MRITEQQAASDAARDRFPNCLTEVDNCGLLITDDSIPENASGFRLIDLSARDRFQGGKFAGRTWTAGFFRTATESGSSHRYGFGATPAAALADLIAKL